MIRTLALTLALATPLTLSACATPTPVSTKATAPTQPQKAGTKTPDAGSNVTQVGQWATADDGLTFRVSKLGRGKVGALASGGTPGDPAVVVTVQIRNDTKKRFDLSLVQVAARVGVDGDNAEQVFQDSYGEGFSGTVAPGRIATAKFMFAAGSAKDLKDVSVEVKPDFDYDSATFEGSA